MAGALLSGLLGACSGGDGGSGGSSAEGSVAPSASPAETAPASGSAPASVPASSGAAAAAPADPAARPYEVVVPSGYDGSAPVPLVLLLHGYSSTGAEISDYFGAQEAADSADVLLVAPDGTPDGQGNQFWDASPACCNFTGTPVDDVAYLTGIVAAVSQEYAVDPGRVYAMGHSNGGFMAHRLACEASDVFAAVASLAGAVDPDSCDPSAPVSVLQVHGDADEVISYTGGSFPGVYPGAAETVATWAGDDACAGPPDTTGKTLDLESALAGAETTVAAAPGCPEGIGVELWTIAGGRHNPQLSAGFGEAVMAFLLDHPRAG